jgi:hypothetical protein
VPGRLYSEYMHAEYGELDSDYVFVNLWGGRRGSPMSYPTVDKLVARIRSRTGVEFTFHMLPPMPRIWSAGVCLSRSRATPTRSCRGGTLYLEDAHRTRAR